jgi:hypothetical protein
VAFKAEELTTKIGLGGGLRACPDDTQQTNRGDKPCPDDTQIPGGEPPCPDDTQIPDAYPCPDDTQIPPREYGPCPDDTQLTPPPTGNNQPGDNQPGDASTPTKSYTSELAMLREEMRERLTQDPSATRP